MSNHPDFRFDPIEHRYFIGNLELPSITSLFKEFGLIEEARFYTDYSRDKGHAAHACCHYFDEDDLDESTVDETIKPYLEAWKLFRKETGFVPSVIEKPMHVQSLFAGTPDRFGTFPNGDMTIVEIKSGQVHWTARLQTVAQGRLFGPGPYERIVVQLKPNGAYKQTIYPLASYLKDLEDFEALIRCHWLKRIKESKK